MNIIFPYLNQSIDIPAGTSIDTACAAAGYPIDRVCGGKGTCGKCRVEIEDGAGRREVLACRTAATDGMKIYFLNEIGTHQILQGASWRPDPETRRKHGCKYGAACDLGTTSVVVTLFDLEQGELIARESALNAQTQIAADIIGRLEYALSPGGAEELQAKAAETINRLLAAVCVSADITPADVGILTVAGNSAMLHLLLSYPVIGLAAAPFECHSTAAVSRSAAELGINIGGTVEVMPLIGSFVGADTTAAAIAAGLGASEEVKLLIDLGTNGEVVLGNTHKLLAASAAAGPAMEGAGISCGMRGANGAIEKVRIEDGTVNIQVIGGVAPIGVCGSGLVDLTAELVRCGTVTPQGWLKDEFSVACGVTLTPGDVRAFQLSKGAIGAAVELLIRAYGIEPGEISEILLAGAFGNYIDAQSAQAIGLLPSFDGVPVRSIGNAAMQGAQMYLLDESSRVEAVSLAAKTAHVELAATPDFAMTFAMHMPLTPMTDLD